MDSADSDKNMAIFKDIAKLVVSKDYQTATQEFIFLHASKFDEKEEENKHEYMQLFEEFVAINDKVIDSKLKTDYGHSVEEMTAFYSSFEENRARYEAEDKVAVDNLFTMISFEAFKKQMFACKTGMVDIESKSQNEADKKAYGNFNIEEEVKIFQQYMAEDLSDPKKGGWKKKVDWPEFKDGYRVTIHQRKQKGIAGDLLRVEAEF